MPTVRPVFHSSASFDLGAKNTGLFLVNHPAGAAPSAEYAAAYTIVQPADGDGLNYSTTNRRAVRHRLRGGKRFKLARRLVLQVIDALRKLTWIFHPIRFETRKPLLSRGFRHFWDPELIL